MRDMVGRRSARNRALKAVGARSAMSGRLSVAGAMMAAMDEHQIVARGVSGVRVVVSASLSSYFDKRYVVVDGATGEVLDDAQGYGYKSAQNAHRAHAYKSMPPKKKRQRDAAKRRVERWCAEHEEFMQRVEQSMFYAMKDGENVTEADVLALLAEHGLELPFSVKDLMRHW